MSITQQLRDAIAESKLTHYRIGTDSGVDIRVLDRFVSGETDDIMGRNVDKLCDYLGFELRRKKGRTAAKQAAKNGAAAGKQPAKKKASRAKKTAKRSAKK